MAGVREKRGQVRLLQAILWLVAVLIWHPGFAQQGKPKVPSELPPQASDKAQEAVAAQTAPTVSLTAPAGGALYTAPATVPLAASATASSGGKLIVQVEFFAGASSIGTATAAPYSFNWTPVAAGSYSLTAKAIDNLGVASTSAAVSIVVNAPPSVSLTSPAGNASFTAPATIPLSAQAVDADGTIARVEFYNGTNLIAALTAPPYSINWLQVPHGNYSLSAQVTDNLGATTTSTAVTVTVNTALAQIYYIHTDHLNTPRAIYDQQQRRVWRWDQTDPFGGNPPNENPSGLGNFTCNLRLPGQYFDRETNLHYNYFRDYDPVIGRYIQSDPIGLSGGLNMFDYALANPNRHSDPFGLDVKVCYYPAGPTHIGFGEPNAPTTRGFYPKIPSQPRGPGVIKEDPSDEEGTQCKIISATLDEDTCMKNCQIKRAQNPGTYNFLTRNCTYFVRGCLSECGLPTGINVPGPSPFFNSLPGSPFPGPVRNQ